MKKSLAYWVVPLVVGASFLGTVLIASAQITTAPPSGPTDSYPGPGSTNTGSGVPSGGLTNPLGSSCTSLTCPASRVVNLLFTIAIPLCAIMVLVGGFQMMMSAGNPEKFSKGKKTLVYAAIGFAVVLIAGSVATLIQNFLQS